MASNSFWIDTDELARLGAELVSERVDDGQAFAEEAPLLDLFGDPVDVGTEKHAAAPPGHQELGRASEQLAAIKERAMRSGLLVSGISGDVSGVEPEARVLPGSDSFMVVFGPRGAQRREAKHKSKQSLIRMSARCSVSVSR